MFDFSVSHNRTCFNKTVIVSHMTFCCSSVCTAPLDARMPQAMFGGALKRVTEMSVRLVHFAFRKLSALVIDSMND